MALEAELEASDIVSPGGNAYDIVSRITGVERVLDGSRIRVGGAGRIGGKRRLGGARHSVARDGEPGGGPVDGAAWVNEARPWLCENWKRINKKQSQLCQHWPAPASASVHVLLVIAAGFNSIPQEPPSLAPDPKV